MEIDLFLIFESERTETNLVSFEVLALERTGVEQFRPWVLMFKACLPIHKAIMAKFSDEYVFWPSASEFSLFNKHIWRASFKELVTFSEQIEGEKSNLGFLDS